MDIRLAPMEGVTDAVHRRVHHRLFGGVEQYYIPFITPSIHRVFTTRDLRAIAPENNAGVPCIPQLLTHDAELFLWAAQELADLGYGEVNLNTGCPSGTVTAKGRGSGMLRDRTTLRMFLDEVFARTPIPVSVKTRIGYDDPAEWEAVYDLLQAYPLHEMIIHPRTRSQMYHGEPYRECYAAAAVYPRPVTYNGDLFAAADCRALMAEFPFTHAVMLGRGLIANPALAQELSGGDALTAAALRDFHSRLLAAYQQRYPLNVVLGRMREVMKHMSCCFEDAHKPRKLIRKAATAEAYAAAADALLSLPLRNNPGFDPYLYK